MNEYRWRRMKRWMELDGRRRIDGKGIGEKWMRVNIWMEGLNG